MKRLRLVGLAAVVAAVAGILIMRFAEMGARQALITPPAAAGVRLAPTLRTAVHGRAEAIAALTSLEARSHPGLTASDIASTRQIYRFDSAAAAFAGAEVFRTAFHVQGFCLTLAVGPSC